jgi:hypothetical protein
MVAMIYFAFYQPDKVYDYYVMCHGVEIPTDYEHAMIFEHWHNPKQNLTYYRKEFSISEHEKNNTYS